VSALLRGEIGFAPQIPAEGDGDVLQRGLCQFFVDSLLQRLPDRLGLRRPADQGLVAARETIDFVVLDIKRQGFS
jgi:hypothetical protein